MNRITTNPQKTATVVTIRFLLLVSLVVVTCTSSKAQSNESFLHPTISSADSAIIHNDSLSIEDKLVALAINGPLFKSSESQNKINEYLLKAAKNQWINLLTLSANLNDQNTFIQNPNVANNVVFPRYFFGVNIPLGTILSRTSVKSAREQVKISKNNQEQLARSIKAEILSKYQRYQNLAELIKLQTDILDNEETAFLQAKDKFRNDQITIDVYNVAQKLYNLELSKKLSLQLEQDLIKLDIERMIGVSLDNIVK